MNAANTMDVAGHPLLAVRDLALPQTRLYRTEAISAKELDAVIQSLHGRRDVRYAQPNYWLTAQRVPNDELYPLQWHYRAIDLAGAWDITTGSASIAVGVIDSGILFDAGSSSNSHPDFAGRILPGYDFISDPFVALDGDGRDPNPFDPGDPSGQSVYHGSHVAGTIAAATDNGGGVAGVNWEAKVVPVRALGSGGGSMVDILDGVLWAAGFEVPGVPTNPNPAHVLNLSLGGLIPCSSAEQEVFDLLNDAGVIVVVAAGNDNTNAAQVTPASCRGVITVGATEQLDERAPYSNYGTRIDVMAPGGDLSADVDGDGAADGVLSLGYDDSQRQFGYLPLQGTSMAAPHVAGVISLMKGLEPQLSTAEAVKILRASARPLDASACQRPFASECGAGMIDAAAALQMLIDPLPPPIGEDVVSFTPDPVDFGTTSEVATIAISNRSEAPTSWSISQFDSLPGNPEPVADGCLYAANGSPTSGTLAALASDEIQIGVDRSKVTADGGYALDLLIIVNDIEHRLLVRFSKQERNGAQPTGATIVAAVIEEPNGELTISGSEVRGTFFTDYEIEVEPGEHLMLAWSDNNGNVEIDIGDHLGVYPAPVQVAPGQRVQSIDIDLSLVIENFTDAHRGALEGLMTARAIR